MTVCYCPDDKPVAWVLEYFAGNGQRRIPTSQLHPLFRWMPLSPACLCRRAIGRNLVALQTQADWVWFTDTDYLFGPGCLDNLAAQLTLLPAEINLVYPRRAIVTSHEAGDRLIAQVTSPAIHPIVLTDFTETKKYNRAIGGIQIARGDVCREKGYLDGNPKWQQPAAQWMRTHEDRHFRASLGTAGKPLDVPQVYRIRHSLRGRFDVGVEL